MKQLEMFYLMNVIQYIQTSSDLIHFLFINSKCFEAIKATRKNVLQESYCKDKSLIIPQKKQYLTIELFKKQFLLFHQMETIECKGKYIHSFSDEICYHFQIYHPGHDNKFIVSFYLHEPQKSINEDKPVVEEDFVETTINNQNNKLDTTPLEETLNKFLAAMDEKISAQQARIDSLEAKLEDVVQILEDKDTSTLTKKVGGMDRQIAKLNKSIEKLASHVVEK